MATTGSILAAIIAGIIPASTPIPIQMPNASARMLPDTKTGKLKAALKTCAINTTRIIPISPPAKEVFQREQRSHRKREGWCGDVVGSGVRLSQRGDRTYQNLEETRSQLDEAGLVRSRSSAFHPQIVGKTWLWVRLWVETVGDCNPCLPRITVKSGERWVKVV